MLRKIVLGFVAALPLLAGQAFGFGDKGHRTVGAVADRRLADTPAANKVFQLLNGLTLAQAALVADDIKSFDSRPDDYVLQGKPELTTQLVEFLKANPKGSHTSDHHGFHYTDVPAAGSSSYHPGTVGRSDHDVVHMISYCVAVLNGSKSENNDKKITKPVALILLAHFVGDIHQPLHVGAEYFDAAGNPVNPDTQKGQYFADKGGQGLTLHLRKPSGQLATQGNLHSYWDSQAVTGAFDLLSKEVSSAKKKGAPQVTDEDIVKYMAGKKPPHWADPTSPVDKWSEEWANEILPQARSAHERLRFESMFMNQHSHTASGQAIEKEAKGNAEPYANFAASVTRENMHKAGWRLALLIEKALP